MKKHIAALLCAFVCGITFSAAHAETTATKRMEALIEELFSKPEKPPALMGGMRALKKMAKKQKHQQWQKKRALKILSKLGRDGGEDAVAKVEKRFTEKRAHISYNMGRRLARRLARFVEELKDETVATKDFAEATTAVREHLGGMGGMGGMGGKGGRGHFGGKHPFFGRKGKKGKKHRKGKSEVERTTLRIARKSRQLMRLLMGAARRTFMQDHMRPIKEGINRGEESVLYVIAGVYKKLLQVPTDAQIKKQHPFISAAARKELIDEVPKMHEALSATIAAIKTQLSSDTATEVAVKPAVPMALVKPPAPMATESSAPAAEETLAPPPVPETTEETK